MRYLAFLILWLPAFLYGNNLEVSSLSLNGNNGVIFDVVWENNWNYTDSVAPNNHDAVWLFCKARSRADGTWKHIDLHPSGHDTDDLMQLAVSNSGTGAMLKRSSAGEGNVSTSVSLSLDVTDLVSAYDEIRVLGMEMVYVPQGSFYVGDTISNNSLITFGSTDPYQVVSESSIATGEEPGRLWSNADFPPAGDLPSAFPKGYTGFYIMKYEMSQIQYAEFLNSLSPVQLAANRLSTLIEAPCFGSDHLDGERNYITEIDGVFGCDANENGILNEVNDGKEVACNFLTWAQMTAYLDWAGLRPMTELEYEKASRGPLFPVPLEFAWGNPIITNTTYLFNSGAASEHVLDTLSNNSGIGNYGYCSPSGPLRSGFAAFTSTDRVASGTGQDHA